jgi:hypothetical protein
MIKKTNALLVMLFVGTWLYAQEKQMDSPGLTIPQNNGEPAIAPPVVASESNADELQNKKREIQYKNFYNQNIAPLAADAEKNGFAATPEEIAAQEKALKVMYPGMPVWENQVRDQILARKYSQTLNGTRTSDADIQNAYGQMQSEYSDGKAPAMADVLPMLQTRAVLENRSVQGKIQELNDQRDAQTNEAMLKAKEGWSTDDLRIKGPANGCIAEHKDSDACLLTIKQYNDFIPYYYTPKFYSLDSARINAIKTILKDSYIANEARSKGFAESDSAAQEKQDWMYGYVQNLKKNKLGLPVWDRNSLWKSYSMFYDALFRTRYYPYYSIIGSSDSVYIDSISRACRRTALPDSQGLKENEAPSIAAFAIPWSYSRAIMLPAEFGAAVDTLAVNGVSPVIRTAYGHFIVRLDSVQVRYEIRFEEAYDQLIILASKQKWFKMDSLLLAKAQTAYSSNRRLNHLPDSLTVTAFLTPEIAKDSLNEEKIVLKKNKQVIKTDFTETGVQITSASLPFDVRDSLLGRYEISYGKGKTIGPIHSRFGVWNFKVIGRERKGGVRPFSNVHKQLIDSLVVHELDCGVDISLKNPDSSFDKTALAKCYATRFYGVRDDDLQEEQNPNQNPKAMHAEKIRDRENEIQEWLSKITIHYAVLANGFK